MRAWGLRVLFIAAVLLVGCEASTRYSVLSTVFDGVPPPVATPQMSNGHLYEASSTSEIRRAAFAAHGPYASRNCDACHLSKSSYSFVVPREQLCFRCHDLGLNKKYIHGPLASGGCTVCHNPHSSNYPHLLVSDSGTFCLHCHQRPDLDRVSAHQDAKAQCISCHDPHMSDRKYLLR